MAETWYLWTRFQNGGETDTVTTPGRGERHVVLSRNVMKPGTKVTAGSFDSEEEFEALKEAGVVRPYPFPEDLSESSLDSPIVHLQKKLRDAAQSEEERLTAQVSGLLLSEEEMANAGAEAAKEEKKQQEKTA